MPSPFRLLGDYPNATRVQAHTRAFVILSHAELESYLETWASDITSSCELKWKSSSRVSTTLACLVAVAPMRVQVPDKTGSLPAGGFPELHDNAIAAAIADQRERIKKNNGIKESSVLRLFGPLGVPPTALGSTLLPNLTSYGVLRGDLVHQSHKAVKSVLDPETEFDRVMKNILADLTDLDDWLVRCKRAIR